MLTAAKEKTLAPLMVGSGAEIFALAADVAVLKTHDGENAARGKKPHQGSEGKKRTLAAGVTWVKWQITHQVSSPSWWKTVVGPTVYLYDGENLIEEVDASGNALARYTDEPRWDGPLAMLRGGVTSYYEQDGLNSVGSLTNPSGALAQTYTYDSYGKQIASTGTLTNPFRYTAREFDSETGIYEYRARYYDQNAGRFLSEDPRQFAGRGVNFYDYVRNNPVNLRDPEGKIPVWGWWCGPDWTGGTFAPYDPSRAGQYHKPWGDTDTACMHHDICYYQCRKGHPCSKGDRAACMRQCDSVLMAEAPYSIMGNTVSWWVWNGNKKPDSGDDDASCPCERAKHGPAPDTPRCHGFNCIDDK